MSLAELMVNKSKELINSNPKYFSALAPNRCQIIVVNDYGEAKPWLCDIPDSVKDIVVISNAMKMSEELFDFIKDRIDIPGDIKIIFTKINISMDIVDEDDLYLLCDVLELINN